MSRVVDDEQLLVVDNCRTTGSKPREHEYHTQRNLRSRDDDALRPGSMNDVATRDPRQPGQHRVAIILTRSGAGGAWGGARGGATLRACHYSDTYTMYGPHDSTTAAVIGHQTPHVR